MAKIIIDEREIEVPAGTKVIEAAARLGIVIPRFCYHPALGSVGACRVCAVKFIEGPVKGIQMSCMVDAADGMAVSTVDAEAVDFRRQVIEWLMLNHPHDCPVCDEGGHCLLQDMTVAGGHGIRRTPGRKRTYLDQDLGPLVQHEMNRCIHCYRCVRFYREFCGFRDLGALRLGHRTFFGRVVSGPLESPFAGNLSDLCPTGVFTDKPSRFFGRRWDYQRSPTICLNCSLGCHTVTSARYRQVARQEARFSPVVNGHFICDRGRYGFFYASLPGRPRQARVDGSPASVEQAIEAARERLAKTGAAAVAVLGSGRSSLETLAALADAAEKCGWRPPAASGDRDTVAKIRLAVAAAAAGPAISLKEIEAADAVLVIGADPLEEAPMLALALRQAVQRGGRLAVLDPRPVALPCGFTHVPLRPDALGAGAGALIEAVLNPSAAAPPAAPLSDEDRELLRKAAAGLRDGRKWAVVCGTDVPDPGTVAAAAGIARRLTDSGRSAGLFYLLPGANAFAAALTASGGGSLAEILEDITAGRTRALVVAEADLFRSGPDREIIARALSKLEFLLVLDHVGSPTAAAAHVFLPTQTVFESGGLFVNQEGRLQRSQPVFAGGTPVRDAGGGDHPPRDYGAGLPGADPPPAWEILGRLAGEKGLRDGREARARAARRLSAAAGGPAGALEVKDLPDDGLRFAARGLIPPVEPGPVPASAGAADELEIVLTDRLFGTEELSGFSACLEPLLGAPQVALQKADADALGVADGQVVRIGRIEAAARVSDRMARGVVVVPRDFRLAWTSLGRRIRRQDILGGTP
jgi:NADH-quinone oxidoreductase subunit G